METPCRRLTPAEVVTMNERLVAQHGGSGIEVLNPGSLEHLLEQIQGSIFGHDPFPSLLDKAAHILHRIARGHIFLDGNKRTAVMACLTFLQMNGQTLRLDMQVIDLTVDVARGAVEHADVVHWLQERISPYP